MTTKPKRVTEITCKFNERMIAKYQNTDRAEILNEIATAIGHKAYTRYDDKQRYVQNWLRKAFAVSAPPKPKPTLPKPQRLGAQPAPVNHLEEFRQIYGRLPWEDQHLGRTVDPETGEIRDKASKSISHSDSPRL